MLQSERLRKALRQFHFRRCEAQIRRELCALLKVLPEAIRFVEWDQHELIVEQVEKYRAEARGGGYPTSGREWSIEEWNQVQEAIMLLAHKMDDNPAYFYIPQYVVSFVAYKGYETCEPPMIETESVRHIFESALKLMDYLGHFEIVFDEGKESISFCRCSYAYYGSETESPELREVYSIEGWGSAVVGWLSHL